jgi:hypothetical protein
MLHQHNVKSYAFYLNYALAAEKARHDGFAVYWLRKANQYPKPTM